MLKLFLEMPIEKYHFQNNHQASGLALRHVESTPDIYGGFGCWLSAFLEMSVNLLEFNSKPPKKGYAKQKQRKKNKSRSF